jgi:hypothetical protein
MVVLYEIEIEACVFTKSFAIEAFVEETAGVAEHSRLDDFNVGDGGAEDFHRSTSVIPTQAGIFSSIDIKIPACAGMTILAVVSRICLPDLGWPRNTNDWKTIRITCQLEYAFIDDL